MKMQSLSWTWVVVGLIAVGLPLIGHGIRRSATESCALDGVDIAPLHRVEVVDDRGESHAFCSLRCARIWLDQQPNPPLRITVTDEVSGEPVPAPVAWYVRSPRVSVPGTGEHIHVFRTSQDAEKHVTAFGGTVLRGPERPLAPPR